MNHTSRSVGTALRKRKDREDASSFYNPKGSFVNKHYPQLHRQPHNNNTTSSSLLSTPNSRMMVSEPGHNNITGANLGSSNRLLAGYMALEFLTKGTLFGQKFDPARAEAMPVSAAEPKRRPGSEPEVVLKKPNRSYAEVAQLLKGVDGAHIPGIVNPTQLARWIQM